MIALALWTLLAAASPVEGDRSACRVGAGSAVQVNLLDLKDRRGTVRLELYPATREDFLKDGGALHAQGKFYRRVEVAAPAEGAVTLCIRAPGPGRYALLVMHDRDGDGGGFSLWSDGVGLPSNERLGRRKPPLSAAVIAVGEGVTEATIHTQYLRGFGGFAPRASR